MDSFIIDYYPLFLIITGTLLNVFTFIILCQSTFKDTKARSTIHYMRAIAIFDIFILYRWNLDHFINAKYGFYLKTYSLFSCKLLSFLNYFTSQSSAWLRVFLCLDRYLAMSRLHRTWFSQSKNVLIIITSIDLSSILSSSYDYCSKFTHSTTIYFIYINYYNITFLIMTMPSNVTYAFFYTANPTVIRVIDALFYTYQITSCSLYFITLVEYRRVSITMFICKTNNQRNQVRPT